MSSLILANIANKLKYRILSETDELPEPMKPAVFLTKKDGYVIGIYIHSIKQIETKTKQIPLVECLAWKYFIPAKLKEDK